MANRFLNRVRGLFRMRYHAPVVREADQSRQVDNNQFRAYAGQGFLPFYDGAGTSDDSRYSKIIQDILKLAGDKQEWCERLEQVRGSDVYETILSKMTDDLMYRHNPEGLQNIDSYFTIQVEGNDKLTDALSLLPHQYGMGRVLSEIAPELLAIGEYILSVNHDARTISDSVDQKNTIAIYMDGRPRYVIDCHEKEVKPASDFVVINLGTTAKKVSFTDKNGKTYMTRLGKSVFSLGVLTKMNSLKLLEALVPIGEIMNIDQKMYYYLKVPTGTPAKDAYKQVKDYELMLYSILNPETKATFDDVIHSIGKIKVLPQFGDQQQLQEKMIPKMDRIELDYLNDIRTNIASLIGIPPSYVGVGENDSPNALASYYQKIAFLRSKVAQGFRFMVEDFIFSNQSDIQLGNNEVLSVSVPEILGVQDIDALDYQAVTSELLNNTNTVITNSLNAIQQMNDATQGGGGVNIDAYKRLLNKKLMPLTDCELFEVPEEKDDGKVLPRLPHPDEEQANPDKPTKVTSTVNDGDATSGKSRQSIMPEQ